LHCKKKSDLSAKKSELHSFIHASDKDKELEKSSTRARYQNPYQRALSELTLSGVAVLAAPSSCRGISVLVRCAGACERELRERWLVHLRGHAPLLRQGAPRAQGSLWRCVPRLAAARNAGVSQYALPPRPPPPPRPHPLPRRSELQSYSASAHGQLCRKRYLL
jgi:hypothetical protein